MKHKSENMHSYSTWVRYWNESQDVISFTRWEKNFSRRL